MDAPTQEKESTRTLDERATIRLAVVDMAGTTVADDGLVEEAFTAAIAAAGVEPGGAEGVSMLAHVRRTMGESKLSVFRDLFHHEPRAQQANRAFEEAYDRLITGGRVGPIPGAAESIAKLRDRGVKVALTTSCSDYAVSCRTWPSST